MFTAPALSTGVPASADDRETACRGQTAHLVEKGFRPINGLLALGERPAGVVAVGNRLVVARQETKRSSIWVSNIRTNTDGSRTVRFQCTPR